MPSDRRVLLPVLGVVATAVGVAGAIAFTGSLLASLAAGLLVLGVGMRLALARGPALTDASRRRFLMIIGLGGMGAVAGGSAIGRIAERATRRDPTPDLDHMVGTVGREALLRVKRGYYPGRSGELQLVLAPFNTSNYENESKHLAPRDPRSSHAMAWGYLDRVPITIYAPGIIDRPETRDDAVTLADLAPTTGALMGFDFPTSDGVPLPGVPTPKRPPKVIVTFVIDGGGWNVYTHWRDAWPNLRRLMGKSLVYRNAFMGSFPTVTASAHATIGTGEFPRGHGISGHNLRRGGSVVKSYGDAGHADPSYLTAPTLAEAWNEHTGDRAWVGEIGYQIWHLGMLGRGGNRPLGKPPVAIYFDEDVTNDWQSQNPDLYRFPEGMPGRDTLSAYLRQSFPKRAEQLDKGIGRNLCCSPPIVRYQGDVIVRALENEPVGESEATSLLYINYKMPDYTGHVYNFLKKEERVVIEHVDRELGRLVDTLESRFKPGEYVLIVTADHGQCPLVDTAGGVRLDPVQLKDDINRAFGKSVFDLVQAVWPSEVYLDHRALWDAGVHVDEVAAFLRDYRYGDNVGPYVPSQVVERDRMSHPEFAAVFPNSFIGDLGSTELLRAGPGRYPDADPGIPDVIW